MADDKSKTGKPDRDRISLSQDYEVRDAAERYGVTKQQIIDAVKAVGPMRSDVEKYLKSKREPGHPEA